MSSIMKEVKDRVMVIDVDTVAKGIYKKSNGIKADLKKTFGQGVIDKYGNILYPKLAEIVFSDKIELNKLNRLMFPLIRREVKGIIKSDTEHDYIIIDAAVLFDAKLDLLCDFIVLVDTNEDLRKIFLKNKNFNDNEIELRIEGQHIKINESGVDFRIINDGRIESLK
ncbi:MAG: dephospho-CoA kinase, partial [Actinobacteria bacterium]|nr:dephospho-CoA kinase [Actinomycetota bacterium]